MSINRPPYKAKQCEENLCGSYACVCVFLKDPCKNLFKIHVSDYLIYTYYTIAAKFENRIIADLS